MSWADSIAAGRDAALSSLKTVRDEVGKMKAPTVLTDAARAGGARLAERLDILAVLAGAAERTVQLADQISIPSALLDAAGRTAGLAGDAISQVDWTKALDQATGAGRKFLDRTMKDEDQNTMNDEDKSTLKRALDACKANPATIVACTSAALGLVVVAAPGIAAVPALAAAGFGSSGIVAGSTAAAAHSSIGTVIAPSIFATFQSAGAGGYGVAAVYGSVQAAGGIMSSACLGYVYWPEKKNTMADAADSENSKDQGSKTERSNEKNYKAKL